MCPAIGSKETLDSLDRAAAKGTLSQEEMTVLNGYFDEAPYSARWRGFLVFDGL